MNIFKLNKKCKKVIYVKYFTRGLDIPELEFTGDWVDVRVAGTPQRLNGDNKFEQVESDVNKLGATIFNISKGDYVKIPLGFALQLPKNYEAVLLPRSSLAKNTGLLFATSGVIDEGYCGDNDEWFIAFTATRDCTLVMSERIAQFRIQEKQPKLHFQKVTKLGNTDRGGHGSTGRF